MAAINRVCAPILVYREDVRENPVTAQRKRESLQEASRAPVPCLVGSVGALSDRIARLPLQQRPGSQGPVGRDKGPKLHLHQTFTLEEKQDKSSSKFTRLTSKQDSTQSLDMLRSNMASEKREEGMPKLVELYQYPGFKEDVPMPLPHNTAFPTIITHVIRAQRHLAHKPRYKAVFQSILSSSMMEDLVVDTFWWLFLQTFQPDGHVQDCLFARIAENYIRILTHNLPSRSGSMFLRELPSTLSQTLYCCYCCCFPQSCGTIRSDSFLTPLCFTAYQWTGGVCPAPDIFKKWDFEALEPEPSSVEFVSGNDTNEKESGSCLSLLDSMFSSTCVSKLSIHTQQSSVSALPKTKSSSTIPGSASLESVCTIYKTGSLASVREVPEEDVGSENITGTELKALTDHGNQKPAKESHAVAGLEFKQSVFNVWGNSPLVQFYLRMLRMEPKVGQDVLVRRTEIHRLPPADSATYRDIMRQTRERSTSQRRALHSMWVRNAQDISNLHQRTRTQHHELLRKQKKILSQRSTVRRLCQLLVPDANTEEDTKPHSELMHLFEAAVSEACSTSRGERL